MSRMTVMTPRHLLPALTLVVLAGCQTLEFGGLRTVSEKLAITNKDAKSPDSQCQTPVRLAAIWSDAMYTQPGLPPTRGFGGRLYFYNTKGEPVQVEGQLVVYAYDDSQQGTPSQTPSRKFAFTPEQFGNHYSVSDLGHSYSVWIPWDQVGGVRKSISLLPVFTTVGGQVVTGEQSINVLPGKAPEVPEPAPRGYFTPLSSSEPQPGVRRVAFAGALAESAASRDSWQQMHPYVPTADNQTQLRSTTIQLPPSMTQRLAQQEPPGAWDKDSRWAATTGGMPEEDSSATALGRVSAPPTAPPATRFVRPRSPAPKAQAAPPNPVRAGTLPRRAEPQPDPPFPPSANPRSSTEGAAPADPAPAGWAQS